VAEQPKMLLAALGWVLPVTDRHRPKALQAPGRPAASIRDPTWQPATSIRPQSLRPAYLPEVYRAAAATSSHKVAAYGDCGCATR